MKLRSLRAGLPAVKEFGEPSTKLEFDEFDDMAADEGQPECKDSNKPPAEEVDESGKDKDNVEDKSSESKLMKKTKPPTVDEYQWQWKVGDPGLHSARQCIDQIPQPQLETTRRTFFL